MRAFMDVVSDGNVCGLWDMTRRRQNESWSHVAAGHVETEFGELDKSLAEVSFAFRQRKSQGK
jgi:hypothetical protein